MKRRIDVVSTVVWWLEQDMSPYIQDLVDSMFAGQTTVRKLMCSLWPSPVTHQRLSYVSMYLHDQAG